MTRFLCLLLVCLFCFCGCNKSVNRNEVKQQAAQEFRQKEKELDKEIEAKKEEARAKAENLKQQLEEIPEIKIDTGNVTFEWAGDKGKTMSAHAESFSGRQTDKVVELKGFSAKLNDKQAAYAADLIAPSAVLYAETKKVICKGGVKVTSKQNNSVLIAESIEWDSTKSRIYAKNARLTTDMGTMTGKNMVLDTALETFEVSD